MTIETIGIFDLVDPPAEAAEFIEDAYSHIQFSWDRVAAGVAAKGYSRIPVLFEELDQNTLGTYTRGTLTIRITTTYGYSHVPFTFAHEVGHLVDHLVLTDRQRATLLATMLANKSAEHDLTVHVDEWSKPANPYLWRINEAWADLFVAAYVPVLWGARGVYSRFSHWIPDYALVRELTQPFIEPVPTTEQEPEMFLAKCKGTAPVFLFSHDRFEWVVSSADLKALAYALGLPAAPVELSPNQWKVLTQSRTQVPSVVPGALAA